MLKRKHGYGLLLILVIAFCVLFILSLYAGDQVKLEDLTVSQYSAGVLSGALVNKKVNEASGMAASRIHDNVLWLINDSGGAAELYAAGTDGADLGMYPITGATCRDWEDIASFTLDGVPYLLIAETGDNDAVHDRCILYFIKEPDVFQARETGMYNVSVDYTLVFQYSDGPRDVESVAVDVANKTILLLSKRTKPPVLYSLPLDLTAPPGVQIAQKITAVPVLPQPTKEELEMKKRYGVNGIQPVAMDISTDGQFAVVLTYTKAFLFPFNTDWKTTFTTRPQLIRTPLLKQSESLCFAQDGRTLYMTSEKVPTPLYRLTWNK